MFSTGRHIRLTQYVPILALAFFFGTSLALGPTTATWSGGAGNWSPCPPTGDALWSTCPTLPDSGTNVTIQGGPVTETNDNESVANLTLDSGDVIDEVNSYLYVYGSSITNNGTINVSGGLGPRLAGSTVTLSGTGVINLQSSSVGIVFANTGPVTFVNQQTISGQGSVGSGTLTINNQGTISAAGGTLTVQPTSAGMTNTGTLQATTGSTMQIVYGIPAPLNNTGGTIHAQTGSTVLVSGPSINGGSLTTAGTGVFQTPAGGGNPTLNGVTLGGVFQILSAGSATLKGTVNNTGSIQVLSTGGGTDLFVSGPVTLNGAGNVTMSNLSSNIITAASGGGSLTSHNLILGSGNIELTFTNRGTVEANQSMPLVIFSSIFCCGNKFTNSGTLIANLGSTLQVEGVFTNLSGGTLSGGTYKVTGTLQLPGDITTNAGQLTLTGTSSKILDQSSANALANLANNAASGGLTLAGNQNLSTAVGFLNAGHVKVSAGSTFNASSYTQTKGTTTVNGTLAMLPSTGAININGGSFLGGGGTLTGQVTSGATLTPANSSTTTGKLIINGTYTQNSTGALDIRVASLTAFSQVNVSGAVTLGGTLNISRLASFIPALGKTFKILSGTTVTGHFASVTGASINSTEHFAVNVNPGDVTLQVVSGP